MSEILKHPLYPLARAIQNLMGAHSFGKNFSSRQFLLQPFRRRPSCQKMENRSTDEVVVAQ